MSRPVEPIGPRPGGAEPIRSVKLLDRVERDLQREERERKRKRRDERRSSGEGVTPSLDVRA